MTISKNQFQSPSSAAKPSAKFTLNLLWGIITVPALVIVLFILTKGVMSDSFHKFDLAVTDTVRSVASPSFTEFVTIITHLASSHIIIPIALVLAAVLAFILKRRWDAMSLFIALIGSSLFNEVMKHLIQRARPADWEHWVQASGYSFPSGHSMVSMSFYGMLGYIIWLHLKEQGKPAAYVLVLTLLLIVCIGLSRIYLGVHFVTDVIAGYAAGAAWLLACIYAMQWLKGRGGNSITS
ncbi:phosphatase PAP2 family protein [Paenibacillus sp. MER TA 81-3]|uniref:phosphatase PAP2 family protein n=1 Tax=Paenibacillus sp. MER TA 81-3 TaxID=2939573 RepID=UPI002041D02B|nr:phosphatase PAP2 family protein [Paenibacillus sp. MER TA 81-3]MCM3341400.1 phosphatase PAP2 family protein [Paenibacillus sp. MER TA 81-3]